MKIKTLWIVKEKESGEHRWYTFTREQARDSIKDHRYWNGFSAVKLVVKQGRVFEV